MSILEDNKSIPESIRKFKSDTFTNSGIMHELYVWRNAVADAFATTNRKNKNGLISFCKPLQNSLLH